MLLLARLCGSPLAVLFQDRYCSEKDAACGDGEENDRSAVGSLGCGRGGGGVVSALGAALSVGWRGCDECCCE